MPINNGTVQQNIPYTLIDLTFNPIAKFLWFTCGLQDQDFMDPFITFMRLGIVRLQDLTLVASPLGIKELRIQLKTQLVWMQILSIQLGLMKHHERIANDSVQNNDVGQQ
jgi:hypothetical protein